MKQLFLLVTGFFSFFCTAQTLSPLASCKQISELEQQAWLKTHNTLETSALNNYNVVYHRCYWEIDPSVNYIKGNITTFFKPTVSNFTQVEVDLASNLTVDSVKYHAALVSFSHNSDDLLQINTGTLIPINALDSLTVYYQGKPSGGSGFGSFVQSTHNGTPIIWTLSEPFGAKTWWPCKQNLSDKIDSIDILVKTPSMNRVASNGLLVSELANGPDKIFHWKSRYPIAPYLVAIAVTNYSVYSDYVPLQNGTLEVLNYVYPETIPSTKDATKDIVKIIRLFDSLLIDYPFAKEKYGHAQFGWSGGMEHQTMSFMGAFFLTLMAHECAHQWFGDHVTCGSWEDIWLNEGFATYFEWQVTERFLPESWTSGLPGIVKSIASSPVGSLRCDDTLSVSRIFDSRLSYAKGGFVLRMLHWKLGDAAFYTALKNYLNDPKLKNAYAKTPQLKEHFEKASGQDLTQFFKQWYYKQGYPTYHVQWLGQGSVVSLTLTQSQSDTSVSFFEMPVPVKFEARGKDTLVVLNNTYSGQVFQIPLNFEAVEARFDPEYRILSANNKVTNLTNLVLEKVDLSLYPNPTSGGIHLDGIPSGVVLEQVEVVDAAGKTVFKQKERTTVSSDLYFPLGGLAAGSYVLKLKTSIGTRSMSFLKED